MPEGFVYGGQTILSHPIFVETILPFLLIFTVVFAVLQKSKILGEGKRQIDAIVALVFGLLVISFAKATGIIVQLIPFLAVALVVILVLMVLIGSFNKGDFDQAFPSGLRKFLMGVAIIAVAIAVFYATNAWQFVEEFFFTSGDSNLVVNIIFVVIIVAAIAIVLWQSKGDSGKSDSD